MCGPGPVLNFVSGVPSGCSIWNETTTGLPAGTGCDGRKFTIL